MLLRFRRGVLDAWLYDGGHDCWFISCLQIGGKAETVNPRAPSGLTT